VNVASRTWPGINAPGGVGKVSEITYEDGVMYVDVDYVLGGKEKTIELEFVKEHTFDEENNGRPARSRRGRSTAEESSSVPIKNPKDTAAITSKKKQPAKRNKAALLDASSKANESVKSAKAANVNKVESKKQKLPASSNPASSKKAKKEGTVSKKTSAIATKPEPKKVSAKKPTETKSREKVQNEIQVTESNIASPPASAVARALPAEETPSRISGVLKNVYSQMTKKAASFVENVIGKTGSQPSSPESTTSSLELEVDNERATQFNSIFSDVMRKTMAESIEILELLSEANAVSKDAPFTELELRSHLERLDKESKVMVT
jgi:hypothetical protein